MIVLTIAKALAFKSSSSGSQDISLSFLTCPGGEAASGVIRDDTHGAKLHGSQLPSDYGRDMANPSSAVMTIKKRGLRRAYNRMNKWGHTWYKGQLWIKPQPCTSVGFDQI